MTRSHQFFDLRGSVASNATEGTLPPSCWVAVRIGIGLARIRDALVYLGRQTSVAFGTGFDRSQRDHRKHEVGWHLGAMKDGLVGSAQFGIAPVGLAGVVVSVEVREIRTRQV